LQQFVALAHSLGEAISPFYLSDKNLLEAEFKVKIQLAIIMNACTPGFRKKYASGFI